ncbi:diacylglycerol/lipid kinase family protein [Caproicibacter sp.]|uniref:diacylglycerol/lipid kinase family protein n=1 Tax=Caproicibacter sp. TaxID=2814884 RepID=UPI0039899AB9
MRYVMIVNPAAGRQNAAETILPGIRKAFIKRGLNPVCYMTRRPGEAAELAAREAEKGGPVRIFAFGGDGTLGEVAEGVTGKNNAEIGIFPCGSGNDYIKLFGSMQDFLSPEQQLEGDSRPVDLIRTELGISINVCSVGLDAMVALNMERLKRVPLVSGSAAYDLGLIRALFGQIGSNLRIRIDDSEEFRGCFLFALAASGRYYGGGYCGAPQAIPDDGLLDFVMIRKPPFYKIPMLVGMYKAGRHIGAKEFENFLLFRRGMKMEIFSEKPAASNRDGEVALVEAASYRVLPHAARFIVPQKDAVEGICK